MKNNVDTFQSTDNTVDLPDVTRNDIQIAPVFTVLEPPFAASAVVVHESTSSCSRANKSLGQVAPNETACAGNQYRLRFPVHAPSPIWRISSCARSRSSCRPMSSQYSQIGKLITRPPL